MASDYLKVPSSEAEWLEISKKLEELWNYPHALGAIDGKHVRIQKPKTGGLFYYNYKHTHHSIILMDIGPEYECLYADVGSNGRVNDSGIWNKTSLLQSIQNGSFKLPADDKLSNGETTSYVFLEDDAFALKTFMMNHFLSKVWLPKSEYITIDTVGPKEYPKICLEISEGEWRKIESNGLLYSLQVPRSGHNSSIIAKSIRETFMEYFVNEGAVDCSASENSV